MIESIAPIGVPSMAPADPITGASAIGAPGVDFSTVIDGAMEQASQRVAAAEGALQGLASGQPVELHDVMIALENARLSVQTLIQVRNRVLEAYQEISRMQV